MVLRYVRSVEVVFGSYSSLSDVSFYGHVDVTNLQSLFDLLLTYESQFAA